MDIVQKSQRNQKPSPSLREKRFPGKPIVEGVGGTKIYHINSIGGTKIYHINNEIVLAAKKDILDNVRRILPGAKKYEKYAGDMLQPALCIVECMSIMKRIPPWAIEGVIRLAKNTRERQVVAANIVRYMVYVGNGVGNAKYIENSIKEKFVQLCQNIRSWIRAAEKIKNRLRAAENIEYTRHITKNSDGVLTDAVISNILNRLVIKKIMTTLGIKAEEAYVDDNTIVIYSKGARLGADACDSTICRSATDLGFIPISTADLFAGVASYIKNENIPPAGNKMKKKVRGILNNLQLKKLGDGQFEINHSGTTVFSSCNQKANDVTERLMHPSIDDQRLFGYCLDYLLTKISKESGWAVLTESGLTRTRTDVARVLVKKPNDRFSSGTLGKIDTSIEIGADNEDFVLKLVEEVALHSKLVKTKEGLSGMLRSGILETEPQFTLQNWPTHPLLEHIKKQLVPLIDRMALGSEVDPQDLKYQTLFRLTTCKIKDIFDDGAKLQSHLEAAGVFSDWKAILSLQPETIGQYQLNKTNAQALIDEQLLICKERAKNSSLPLDIILGRKGIFSREGLRIKIEGQGVTQKIYAFDTANEVELEFREIDIDLATQYHRDLHYIHTPRAKLAFGMFEKGNPNPFSVLAFDSIDRPYKQNVLLLQGYDPQNSLDVARLYSWPGCPKNASSSMFSLSMQYLKERRPETQALLSSFMPSYTSGLSMTSGGFNNPVLIKPTKHVFVRRIIDGKIAWEHLTKRRLGNSEAGTRLESSMPLLPTIELMATLQPPRFEPATELTGKMVSIMSADCDPVLIAGDDKDRLKGNSLEVNLLLTARAGNEMKNR